MHRKQNTQQDSQQLETTPMSKIRDGEDERGTAGKGERSLGGMRSTLSNAKATPAMCLSVLCPRPNQATRHACAHRSQRRREPRARRPHQNQDIIFAASFHR